MWVSWLVVPQLQRRLNCEKCFFHLFRSGHYTRTLIFCFSIIIVFSFVRTTVYNYLASIHYTEFSIGITVEIVVQCF